MSRRLWAVLAVISLLAAGCGSLRPKSDFKVLGSGSVVTVPVNGAAAAGTGGGNAPSGTSATGPGGGPSTGNGTTSGPGVGGTNGTAGTNGHTSVVGGGKGGTKTSGTSGPAACAAPSTAPGVTSSTITIGSINTMDGPFPPDEFSVSLYGLDAYVKNLNAHGGVCGRQLRLIPCNDHGDNNANVACAHQLIDSDHVLDLVGTSVYSYAGASYVSSKGVSDIGGQPVDGHAYYTYPHMYSILGSIYPNNGTSPAHYWGNYGLGLWFKQHLHLKRAGVIYYAVSAAERGAAFFVGWLQKAGVHVDEEQIPLLGDPSGAVQDMKSKGDQAIFDGLDISGNQKVCQAMDNYDYHVPKISTPASWNSNLGSDFGRWSCVNDYYSWEFSTNYDDTADPQVAQFRKAFATFEPGRTEAQWSLDGWAAGMWFTAALQSCKAITRACVENFVNSPKGYSANGLLDPNTTFFPHWSSFGRSMKQCISTVKWVGGANGHWQTEADHKNTCYTTPLFSYN